MNIWIINHYAHDPKEYGGTRHYDMARTLIQCGHQVTIFAASFHHYTHQETRQYSGHAVSQREVIDGIQYVWIKVMPYRKNGVKRVWGMWQFRRRVLKCAQHISDNPDMILASSPHLLATDAAAILAKRYQVPFVMEVRDIWPLSLIELGLSRWHPFTLWLRYLEQKCYRHADHMISVIPYLDRYLQEQGVDTPFAYINHGVDLQYLNHKEDKTTVPQSVGKSIIQLVYAGSLGRANKIHVLVQAAAQLAQLNVPVQIDIYGEGPMKMPAVQQVQKLGLSNITFHTAVSRQAIFAILQQADILFCNMPEMQLYRYGISPNKLNDYLLAARPIIYACRSENDIVGTAKAGMTIPPHNAQALVSAVQKMIGLPETVRQEMGQNGLAYAKAYCDIDKNTRQLEKIFQRLLAKRSA